MPDAVPQTNAIPACQGFGATTRGDTWWLGPVLTVLGLGGFVVYATWRAFFDWNSGLVLTPQGYQTSYAWGPYLSPFFSPEIFGYSHHAWFGAFPSWWPAFIPATPALLILWAPAGFRATCYYYRKAYYRSFFADPPGCAVGEPWNAYKGETAFPWILQNMHRFFMYVAVLFIVMLTYDGVCAYLWSDPLTGQKHFGMGLGSLLLTLNPLLLAGYTFGCHSCRHIVGGKLNCFSDAAGGAARYKAWSLITILNRYHMQWAWCSLFMVGFTDFYVRMVALGVWKDPRFF